MSSRIFAAIMLSALLSFALPCPPLDSLEVALERDTARWIFSAEQRLLSISKGYPFAEVVVSAYRSDKEELWYWGCEEEAGDLYLIAPLTNAGKSRTSSARMEKMAGRPAGKEWELSSLERIEQRLLRTGYFQRTAPAQWQRVQRRQLLRPVLSLDDQAIRRLELQLEGDDRSSLPRGLFLLDWGNLAGTGRDFFASYQALENEENEAFLSYKEPWLFGGPAARLQGGAESADSSYSRLWGEAGLEWQGERLTVALFAGTDHVIENGERDSTIRRQNRWGRISTGLDLRQFHHTALLWSIIPTGGRVFLDAELLSPDNAPKWTQWSGGYRWRNALAETPLALVHSVKLSGRWPWRSGWNREGFYAWGGATTLRGYREKELRSIGYALASLQPEWTLSRRWRLFSFVDAALDWDETHSSEALHRWGWGAGGIWVGDRVQVGLSLAWPGKAPSIDDALFLLSWDNRF